MGHWSRGWGLEGPKFLRGQEQRRDAVRGHGLVTVPELSRVEVEEVV